MALFRLGGPAEPLHAIRGEGVYLRPLEPRDFAQWISLRERSRAFLAPWEPTWPADDLTKSAFRRRLRRHGEEIDRDEAYPFLIFREADGVLVGGLTLGQVRRGVAQTVTLGYWMGAPFAGQGYMSRAVRSIGLLERNGFQREGLARSYLRINGTWQDHLLFARLDSDPVPLRTRLPQG
jgi:ribosomal-protein-alanine N-acetyltransferase